MFLYTFHYVVKLIPILFINLCFSCILERDNVVYWKTKRKIKNDFQYESHVLNFLFLFTSIMFMECHCFMYVGANISTRKYAGRHCVWVMEVCTHMSRCS